MPRRRLARSFFDRKGRARGAGEVYALLAASHGTQAAASAAPAFAPDQPVAFARSDGPALHGLFRTDGRRGPISEEVASLWRAGNAADAGTRVAATEPFFPRSTPRPDDSEFASATAAAAPAADVPLPPRRPASLGASAVAPQVAAQPIRLGAIGRPLDLLAFMSWRRRA
jgi:hypothetical protein